MSLKRHLGQKLLVEGLAIYRAKIAIAIKPKIIPTFTLFTNSIMLLNNRSVAYHTDNHIKIKAITTISHIKLILNERNFIDFLHL